MSANSFIVIIHALGSFVEVVTDKGMLRVVTDYQCLSVLWCKGALPYGGLKSFAE